MGLWDELKRKFTGSGSEERALHEEVRQLDRKSPGWDRESCIISAQVFLQSGFARAACVRIYGEELVREAERRNENDRG